jgi:hypothetical protein
MHARELSTYINDHLAGSVAALELLDDLIARPAAPDEPAFFLQLRDEFEQEQDELRAVLRALGEDESSVRKAAGWLAEKATRLKLKWDDPGSGALRRFEALEGLAIGIFGKLSLWRVLAAVATTESALQFLDCSRLARQAESQHEEVEARRVAAAVDAFTARV